MGIFYSIRKIPLLYPASASIITVDISTYGYPNMSRSLNLYRLQQVDSQCDKANTRLREIESLLANNAAIQSAEKRVAKTGKELDDASKKLRQAETKVGDQRIKIEQNESILYGGKIRNPKELQDKQEEVAALKRYLIILEDRLLEAMLVVDDAEDAHNTAQDILAKAQDDFEILSTKLIAEREHLLRDITQCEIQRQATETSISEADLKIYSQLRKSRAGIAVAKVNDRACSACGSTLSAALYQAARSPNQITFCDSCDRILYGN
jgi:predicted  nucleic acid-binding Zn-ribbon protein